MRRTASDKRFPRNSDGTLVRRYRPTRSACLSARAKTPEREGEVAMELLLGTRPPRVGRWGVKKSPPGSTAHFWLADSWKALGAHDEPTFTVESACGQSAASRYISAPGEDGFAAHVREVFDVPDRAKRRRVCLKCAFAVEMEDA